MQFSDFRLAEPILRSLANEGYLIPTPVQQQAIPPVMEGRDVLGSAQTGTGKTAAFAVPMLHRLSSSPLKRDPGAKPVIRAVVLCPTRELASQIGQSFAVYGRGLGLSFTVIFGGVGQGPQVTALRRGVDIVIATPGRLMDLMAQGHVDLRQVKMFVLDEADRMLDIGFIHDIRKIAAALPAVRQNLLFSATMPQDVRRLADTILKNPVTVQVAATTLTADRIDQSVYFVRHQNKSRLLAHLFEELPMSRAIVFTRTKHGADRVVRHLHTHGIRAEAIHGNKSQNVRQRALQNFRSDRTPILVATDIASRGIDVEGITHVVNYDMTHEPETYIHRIGRTARAGASGMAVSFCDNDEMDSLKAIERLIRRSIPVRQGPQLPAEAPRSTAASADLHSPLRRPSAAAIAKGTPSRPDHGRTNPAARHGAAPPARRGQPGRDEPASYGKTRSGRTARPGRSAPGRRNARPAIHASARR